MCFWWGAIRRALPACTAPDPGPGGPISACQGIRLPAGGGVCGAPAMAVKGKAGRLEFRGHHTDLRSRPRVEVMARIARVVAPGLPHHITRQETRRGGSGNKYGVPGISNF
jgi:hypothetical protein